MVKPIPRTVSLAPFAVGGVIWMTKMNKKTDDQIIRMRFRDRMNGWQNAYLNDKSTSLPQNQITPSKPYTNLIITTMNAMIAEHEQLCKTYKAFDMTNAVDKKLRNDMIEFVATLQNLHLTKKDKIAMIENDLAQQIALLQQKAADAKKALWIV